MPQADGGHPLFYTSVTALGLLAWILCHPYQGLFHDANLYALQALAHLDPESLQTDIFLRFGSQDSYSLFSPLYAGVMSLVGIDRAAALLTLLSQAGLAAAAWLLAATFVPRWAAAGGVALLFALPCGYGPMRVFTCVESFLTPRMAAEAFTLAALALAWRGRRAGAASVGLLAVLLHPVMAMAGVAVIIAYRLLVTWHAGARTRAVVIGGALYITAFAGTLFARGQFDADWLSIVQERSPYLFLGGWQRDDVTRALVGLLPLAAGSMVFAAPLRTACQATLLAALAGWLTTGLGADAQHAVLVTQMQPWRIEWLAAVAAALLLPCLLAQLWRAGGTRRCAALLLVAALMFGTESYAVPIGVAALILLALGPFPQRYARLALVGAAALGVLAATWRVASNLEFTDAHYMDAALPLWLRRAMSFANDGMLLGALLMVAVWLDSARQRAIALACLLAGTLAVAGAAARHTLSDWLARAYPAARMAQFEPWRTQIPPQAEVFWNGSPMSAWVLLDRAHYLSGLQSSGVVFSRDAALELKRRALMLSAYIPPDNFLRWRSIGPALALDAATLSSVCRLGVIDYLVSEAALPLLPMATLPHSPDSRRALRLYRCADPR